MGDLTGLQMLLGGLSQAADRPLVSYRDQWHSGADILAAAEGFAAQMRQAGLGSGQCVWIIVTDNLSAMQMQMAAWLLEASSLLLDFRSTAHRFAQLRDKLPPDLVVCTRKIVAAEALAPLVLRAERASGIAPGAASADLIADYATTSGSTGLPKLTALTQARMGQRIRQLIHGGERGPWGVALSALSVAFPASRFIWYRNLAAGVPLVALDLLHSLAELDAGLMRPDVADCTLPPAVIRRLAHLPVAAVPRYPHLTLLQAVGGPALAADKVLAVRHLTPNYAMTYSCTECGVISRISGAEVLARPASCGRLLPGVQLTIQQDGRDGDPGQVGEISVTRADGIVVQTGDLGWLDADGYLYVTGRVQGLLCRNGVNFSADRLTDAALMAADVLDAVVVALPGPDGDDQVHLIVECHGADQTAIAAQIRSLLPAAEQPDRHHFMRGLPRGAGGKVDMPQLRDTLIGILEAGNGR